MLKLKRILDVVLSLLAIVILSPAMVVLATAVLILLGRPVFFRQVRPGLHARPFIMHKFRTMADSRDEHGNLLPDEQRLGWFGRFMRSLSLDELPELFSVLLGDMSIVGPRPLLMQYLGRYTSQQARRHEMRPGLTGWAQVNGRNSLSWEDRLSMDVWYIDNWSLALDARILLSTLRVVISRRGVSADGHATMPEFTGTPPDAQTGTDLGR